MINKNTKRIVITGGACCGKTTLLENLSAQGLQIVSEAARDIIEEQQKRDTDILPWKNNYAFQIEVLKTQLEREHSYDSKLIFCDRGNFDSIAYCNHARVQTPNLVDKLNPNKYDLIIVPEILPVYVNDSARKESEQDARAIHEKIVQAYNSKGYEVIRIPVLPKQERADYLIKTLLERRVL